jgi:hypothetical protein
MIEIFKVNCKLQLVKFITFKRINEGRRTVKNPFRVRGGSKIIESFILI